MINGVSEGVPEFRLGEQKESGQSHKVFAGITG